MDLHSAIADLGTVLRPDLTILDAMKILKTGGPTGPGDVDPFGGVVVGTDPVAVDAYGIKLMGRTIDACTRIRLAAQRNLGAADLTLRMSSESWFKVQAGRSEGLVSDALRSEDGGFEFDGPDALKALQRVYVSDMRRVREGRIKYSAMCNDDGCVIDDGVVVKQRENDYYFTTSTGRAGRTAGWIRYHTRFDNWDFHLGHPGIAEPAAGETGNLGWSVSWLTLIAVNRRSCGPFRR